MGTGYSQNRPYGSSPSSNMLGDSDNSIFEVGFDELFLATKFESELLTQSESESIKPLILPSGSVVADIMTDPVAFVSLQTGEEAWREILAPLFTGTDRTKPLQQQVLSVLCRFFKDRPTPIIETEIQKRIGVIQQINADKPLINRAHNKFDPPKISNFESIMLINDESSLKTDLPFLANNTKISSMSANPLYSQVSQHLIEILNKENANPDNMAMYLLSWGFYASDISCIIQGLMKIASLIVSNHSSVINKKFSYPMQNYADLLGNIVQSNCVNILSNKPKSYAIPDFSLPSNPSSSSIACDGNCLYIIGTHSYINVVSLNKGIVNTSSRFRKILLSIPKKERVSMGLTISSGYAYINGPFMPKPLLYKLPHFELVKEDISYPYSKLSRKSKLRAPFTSDGQFIYSFDKSRHNIMVYIVNFPKIVLHRSIPITVRTVTDKATLNDFVPKDKNFPIFTNGTVLTVGLLTKVANEKYYYNLRHFSLIDGSHICDSTHIQMWPLFAITSDPWNRLFWELAPEKDRVSLIQIPNYSAQPLWLTDSSLPSFQPFSEIITSISTAKTMKNAYTSLNSALSFIATQLNGCSFKSILLCLQQNIYNVKMTQFMAPCTPEVIKTLIDSINFYKKMLLSGENKKKLIEVNMIKSIMLTIMRLLCYNLMNFEARVTQDGKTISLESTEFIVTCLLDVLQNEDLSFLHRSAGFVFVNSFAMFLKEPNITSSKIFKILLDTMPNNFLTYMLMSIDNLPQFPYVIFSNQVREIFLPILKTFASVSTPEISLNNSELVSSYMRLMMLELQRVYTDNQVELPKSATILSESFSAFANLMYEVSAKFFENIVSSYSSDRFKFHPFVRFFNKWLVMLGPFTQFSRLSTVFTAILKLFFDSFSNTITKINERMFGNPGVKEIPLAQMIFYELFSLYLNFLSALLDGGSELKEATQFLWLIKSTVEGKVTTQDIDELLEGIRESANQKTKQKHLLKKGFSFNIIEKFRIESDMLRDFVSNLSAYTESENITALLDYLYKKVNNPLNKKLTSEDRWIERLILGALSKQLGVSAELMDMSLKLSQGEMPVLSHFIKQIMEAIYRLRRILKQSKQATTQFMARCEQNMTPAIPEKIEENYDEYLNQVTKKAVFLLHIQPCLRFQSEQFEKDFPTMLKNLQVFITATISLEDYFKLIVTANKSRNNISTGIQLINDFLKSSNSGICSAYLIDKFASSGSIINYLSSLESNSKDRGIMLILQLMNLIRDYILQSDSHDGGSANSLLVLYANLILSISQISPKDVFKPMATLLGELTKKHSGENYKSYLSFLASAMVIIYQSNKELRDSDEFSKLISSIFPSKQFNPDLLSVTRICYKAGFSLSITPALTMDLFSECSPSLYHSTTSFLFELIKNSINKIEIFSNILNEMCLIISGKNSLIMKNLPYFKGNVNNIGSMCKSSSSIISGVSELIQICRHVLIVGDEISQLFTQILDYILTVCSPSTESKSKFEEKAEFAMFKNKRMLYAVFAILSNVIEDFHINSLVRDEATNSIYYIAEVNQEKGFYVVWKLPITKDSEAITLDFSPGLKPVSAMPFTTSMYTNYDALIPYFLQSLKEDDSNFYSMLVLASLKEYSTNQQFLNVFFEKKSNFSLKSISYSDSLPFFQQLLASSLRQESNGFEQLPDSMPKFYDMSIYDYKEMSEISIDTLRYNGNDPHFFISSPISKDKSCTFQANVIAGTNFQIGAYVLSTSESGSEYIMLTSIDGKFLETAEKNIPNSSTVEVKFDPEFGTTVLVNKERIRTKPISSSENSICFLIICYEPTIVKYSLNSGYCKYSFAPLSGKAVFMRRKHISKNNNKNDNRNENTNINRKDNEKDQKKKKGIFIKTSSYFLRNKIHLDQAEFRSKTCRMEELPINQIGSIDYHSLVEFPKPIIDHISGKLMVSPPEGLDRFNPIVSQLKSDCKQCPPIEILKGKIFAFIPNGDDRFIFSKNEKDLLYVNKFSGEVQKSGLIEGELKTFPVITPRHYSMLPTPIVNYFATGYLSLMRNESLNNLFIQLISSTSIPIEQITKAFGVNSTQNLVQIVIRLVVLLEPISITERCPVNFAVDVTSSSPRLPKLHSSSFALAKLLKYIEDDKTRLEEFVDQWLCILKSQFHDGFSHSAQPDHPQAAMKTFKGLPSGFYMHTLIREDVTQWIIIPVNFFGYGNRTICRDRSKLFKFNKESGTYVAIPLIQNNNDSIVGTFFDLVLSMKYFVKFVRKNSSSLQKMKEYRTAVHQLFFESLIANSLFFRLFIEEVFQFIEENIVVCGADIEGDFTKSLNALAIYCSEVPLIYTYLSDLETLYHERILLPLKSFFPEFLTPSDTLELSTKDLSNISLEVPLNIIPNSFENNNEVSKTVNNLRRILKTFDTLAGFPFHFLLEDWCKFTQRCPPFTTKQFGDIVIMVNFTHYVPKSVLIMFKNMSATEKCSFAASNSPTMAKGTPIVPGRPFAAPSNPFYMSVRCSANDVNWISLPFTIISDLNAEEATKKSQETFCEENHEGFVADMRIFAMHWKSIDDQRILDCIEMESVQQNKLSFNILIDRPELFLTRSLALPMNLILIRAKLLLIVNWCLYQKKIDLKQNNNKIFSSCIWAALKVKEFRDAVIIHSSTDTGHRPSLEINRKAATDIRLGLSTNLNSTLIRQMSSRYEANINYRVMDPQPWHVRFTNEEGIDAGGVGRELVADCALDLCCPLSGLVVQTPNGRNDVGDFRDCVIPVSKPQHGSVAQYRFAGALLGIAIRTGLVQQFNFPPIVWEYLISETISIQSIFEIDNNYKLLITSLQEAMKSDMSEDEFSRRFNMKFVVVDSMGNECPLTQRGKAEPVSLSNCGLYISLANDFRVNEMAQNLAAIRNGLWENLDFQPPPSLDWQTLEFSACGQKEISLENLKKVTSFSDIDRRQQEIFWRVVEAFTPEERSMLLKFATARARLPPQIEAGDIFFKLDSRGGIDSLPTSSTCFHQLHYPGYSSFDVAYKMIKIAIEFTGSFETG